MLELGQIKWSAEVQLDVSAIPPQSVQTESFTVPGVFPSWELHIGAPSLPAGLFLLCPARVSAKDTVELTFYNVTDEVIASGSQTIRFLAF